VSDESEVVVSTLEALGKYNGMGTPPVAPEEPEDSKPEITKGKHNL
jgi:hypothetical protein